jgi:hypothetical protein
MKHEFRPLKRTLRSMIWNTVRPLVLFTRLERRRWRLERRFGVDTFLLVGLMACAGRAGAAALYTSQLGVNTPTGPTNDNLYQFDQATGVASVVGKMGIAQALDLASDWRPASARLWAASDDSLYRLGADGVATLIGSFGTGPGNLITSLAFDPLTNRMFGTTNATGDLYQIDPQTGAATRLVHLSVPGALTTFSFDALACDLQGNLWGSANATYAQGHGDRLVIIDPSTGAGTVPFTRLLPVVHDLAFRPEDGAMFLTVDAPGPLYRLDPATGSGTFIGQPISGVSLYGLAFVDLPEPGLALLLPFGIIPVVSRRHRCGGTYVR